MSHDQNLSSEQLLNQAVASQKASSLSDLFESENSTATQAETVQSTKQDGSNTIRDQLDRAQKLWSMLDKAPEAQYTDRLEMANIPAEYAKKVLNCILLELKPWQESFEIKPGYNVVFRTRLPRDLAKLNSALESLAPRYQSTKDFEIAKYNLAGSLVSYGDISFDSQSSEGFKRTLEWVMDIPHPVFELLTAKLREFENKISLVFSPGYEENF